MPGLWLQQLPPTPPRPPPAPGSPAGAEMPPESADPLPPAGAPHVLPPPPQAGPDPLPQRAAARPALPAPTSRSTAAKSSSLRQPRSRSACNTRGPSPTARPRPPPGEGGVPAAPPLPARGRGGAAARLGTGRAARSAPRRCCPRSSRRRPGTGGPPTCFPPARWRARRRARVPPPNGSAAHRGAPLPADPA